MACWDISKTGILKTKDEAGELATSHIHPIICDIAEEDAVKKAMAETVAIAKPHVLVNNAGPVAVGEVSPFMDMMLKAMAMIHHVTTAFLATEPAEGAATVNISSVAGAVFGGGKLSFNAGYPCTLTPATGGSWYACAKAGIVGYIKNMACEQKGKTMVNFVARLAVVSLHLSHLGTRGYPLTCDLLQLSALGEQARPPSWPAV